MRRGQRSKFDLILPQNHILACHLDPARPMWTKIGTVKQRYPGNKPVMAFFKICKFDLARRGQRSKFDLILTRNHVLACRSDLASPMWTKIGKVKQLDPGNQPVMAFFQNLQI